MTVIKKIKQQLHQALSEHEQHINFNVTASKIKEFDFQTNLAFMLSKIRKKKPLDCAHEIQEAVKSADFNIEISGPGFINIALSDKALIDIFRGLPQISLPRDKTHSKVIVDYSSPNVAKDFHVGHLRSTIIGDSLANTLDWLGFDVLRLNHIGDWGTAFGMLIAHIKNHYQLRVDNDDFELSDLMIWYKESKARFDEDRQFYDQSKEEVVKLQSGDEVNLDIWKKICQQSEKAYQEIYNRLSIKDLKVRGESFYNPFLHQVIKDCESKDILSHDDGAKCLFLEGFFNRENQPLPLIVQKSDGGFNYATTDLAALKHRFKEEKAHKVFYVTDSGQRNHFEMIFAAGQKLGYIDNLDCVKHVPFGLVLDKNKKKFKTRSGETIKLKDLLDQGCEKAHAIASEKQLKDVDLFSKVVGIGAIKYADLSNNKLSDYVFDFDKMLSFDGNTVVYILYAYVRIHSLKTKQGFDNTLCLTDITLSDTPFNEHEKKLLIALNLFPGVIQKVCDDLSPNHLTDYLYSLANDFHGFFQHCPIKDHPEGKKRLCIANEVASVLKIGLEILGCDVIYEM